MTQQLFHAWFSQKAVDADCGSSIYKRADGTEVEITAAYKAEDPNVPRKGSYAWPDVEYRGLVTEWVRTGQRSIMDDFDDCWSEY